MTEPSEPAWQLARGLEELGFADVATLADRLLQYGRLLLEANERTNLVGARTMSELVTHHFLDSLAPLSGGALRLPVVDAGSGAGLPGIPYAIARPASRVVLIEPRRLRAEFLKSAIVSLGLSDRVTALQRTCEAAGRSHEWREHAGTVLVRAVAKPPLAIELGVPLLSLGGRLVLYRGREKSPSTSDLAIAELYGAVLETVRAVTVPFLDADRNVWVFHKVRKAPEGYPRRKIKPQGRPLTAL